MAKVSKSLNRVAARKGSKSSGSKKGSKRSGSKKGSKRSGSKKGSKKTKRKGTKNCYELDVSGCL